MQIFVDDYVMPGNHQHTLDVNDTDTVRSLKVMIQSQTFMNDEQHLLIINGRNLLEMDSSSTLHECGITEFASLLLCGKGPFWVYVHTHMHGDHSIEVECCFDPLRKLKEKIEEKTGVPVMYQPLDCVLLEGSCSRFVLMPDVDQTMLSYGIFKRLDLREPYCVFTLRHTFYERMALARVPIFDEENFRAMHEAIDHTFYESMALARVPVFDEENFRALHEAVDSGQDLEELFESGGCLPPLIWPDEDKSTTKLEITVDLPNMQWNFPLTVKPTNSIRTVRSIIRRESFRHDELHGQAYIHDGLYTLRLDRKPLECESCPLDECGIKHMDHIMLCGTESFPIDIHAPERGLRITLMVQCLDTIHMLKEEIQRETGITPEKQRLQYRALSLDDDESRCLVDYCIVKPLEYDKSVVGHGDQAPSRQFFIRDPPYWSVHKVPDPADQPRFVITLTVAPMNLADSPRRPGVIESDDPKPKRRRLD